MAQTQLFSLCSFSHTRQECLLVSETTSSHRDAQVCGLSYLSLCMYSTYIKTKCWCTLSLQLHNKINALLPVFYSGSISEVFLSSSVIPPQELSLCTLQHFECTESWSFLFVNECVLLSVMMFGPEAADQDHPLLIESEITVTVLQERCIRAAALLTLLH